MRVYHCSSAYAIYSGHALIVHVPTIVHQDKGAGRPPSRPRGGAPTPPPAAAGGAGAAARQADQCRCRAHSAMASRADKAHRIGALRARLPHMSQAAYAAMLAAGKNGEFDEMHGALRRADVRKSRDAVSHTQTFYGALHQEVRLSDDLTMEVCAPAAMLAHVSCLGPIRRLLERALAGSESRRLNLILYADEVTPGNNLAHKHARKTWAWYWSVQEFGPSALASEDRTGWTPSPTPYHVRRRVWWRRRRSRGTVGRVVPVCLSENYSCW